VLLLAYIGGALNRGIKDQSDDEIVAQVDKDLRKMLIREDAPKPRKVGLRVWEKAIPQFNVGHTDAVEGAQAALVKAGWGGVVLGGNYVCGVALGKCMEFGYNYADTVAAKVKAAK
jgi:oxygen-dependent protoporphyrinogen oxidase